MSAACSKFLLALSWLSRLSPLCLLYLARHSLAPTWFPVLLGPTQEITAIHIPWAFTYQNHQCQGSFCLLGENFPDGSTAGVPATPAFLT